MRTRCSVVACALLVLTGWVNADAPLDPDAAWLKNAETTIGAARDAGPAAELMPSAERMAAALRDARALDAQARAFVQRGPTFDEAGGMSPFPAEGEVTDDRTPSGSYFRLFISQAMPRAEIEAALAFAAARRDTIVMLRGVRAEQSVSDLVRWLVELSRRHDPPPAVEIDPTRFSEAAVDAVPALVRYDGPAALAQVRGVLNPAWLDERVAAGARGDLGRHGQLYPVVERDLVAAMQEKLLAYDWARARATALARYWQTVEFTALPVATVAREREVDPSFEVSADVVTPDGVVIARAGERYNVLDVIPFNQKLVVFDATDPRQRARVAAEREPVFARPVYFLTTTVPRDDGLEAIGRWSEELGSLVTLLTPEIRDRFALERVPAVIEARGNRFLVRELAITAPAEGSR